MELSAVRLFNRMHKNSFNQLVLIGIFTDNVKKMSILRVHKCVGCDLAANVYRYCV